MNSVLTPVPVIVSPVPCSLPVVSIIYDVTVVLPFSSYTTSWVLELPNVSIVLLVPDVGSPSSS